MISEGNYEAVLKLSATQSEVESNPELIHLLSISLFELGQHDKCARLCEKFCEAYPSNTKLLLLLARSHIALCNWSALLSLMEKTEINYSSNAEILYLKGVALQNLSFPEEATAEYELAIKNGFYKWEVFHNLGVIYHNYGLETKAKFFYFKALAINRYASRTWASVSQLIDFSEQPSLLQKLTGVKRVLSNDLDIEYALYCAHKSMGRTESSYGFLINYNRLSKEKFNYSIQDDLKLFSDIKRLFSNTPVSDLRLETEKSNIKPIFIVGMPRSGTTLLEQHLIKNADINSFGELEHLNHILRDVTFERGKVEVKHLIEIRYEYLRRLEIDETVCLNFIDKMPLNFRWLGLIKLAFPESKIIYIRRNRRSVIWSNFSNAFVADGLAFGCDLHDTDRYYREHIDLMNFWKTNFDYVEVVYEDLIQRFDVTIHDLLSVLGVAQRVEDFSIDQRYINTASNTQVRKSISSSTNDKWTQYANLLPKDLFDHE